MFRLRSVSPDAAARTESPNASAFDPLDESAGVRMTPGGQELRGALRAQKERALGFTFSAVVAVLANGVSALDINYPASLTLLAAGYLSTLVFALMARRSWRATGRVNLVSWWVAFDVLIITAMVHFTGGLGSPWWIWYLACAGTAVLHRGRRYATVAAILAAVLYVGVLAVGGDVHGFDHGFFLAVSRLLFLAGAGAALLLNARRLRQSGKTIRCLRDEAEARTRELQNANRELLRLNGNLQDMADLIRDLTLKDALTGLRNRRYLQERIADDAAKRGRGPRRDRRQEIAALGTGLLMLDLDDLERINGTHGREAGDLALKHVAQALLRSVRSDDLVFRWGGDELVILLPRIEAARMAGVAEKMAQSVRSQPLTLPDGAELILTVSLGWSFVDQDTRGQGASGWEAALAAAETALDAARSAGRGEVHEAESDEDVRLVARR